MDTSPPSPPLPLLTGASGFVGRTLQARLGPHERLSLARADWREAIAGTDFGGRTVIHLAARVHDAGATEADFQLDNVEKTRQLAIAAAAGGAARFVFASTAKVFGEESPAGGFREEDAPAPEDAYARSKLEAEGVLRDVARSRDLPVVVVRFPLVYGPGAAGNFRSLVKLAGTGLWLPFAGIVNRRSLVHVDDLAQALRIAATHTGAVGRVLVAAHPAPVSTPGLVRALRTALGRPARLFALPPGLLETTAALAGRRALALRLTRSLEVVPSTLVERLGWVPRFDLPAGMADAVGAAGAAP